MAIFNPSNVIPSSFAGGGNGTVAATDPVSVSWQVNGNSPLDRFLIYVRENNTQSTLIGSSGMVSGTSYGLPFYGKDAKGNPTEYTYSPTGVAWQEWGVENGKDYKLQITQFWRTRTYYLASNQSLNGTYYATAFGNLYQFQLSGTSNNYLLAYSIENDTMFLIDYGIDSLENPAEPFTVIPCIKNTTTPHGEHLVLTFGDSFDFITQYSDSAFIARSHPTVSIDSVGTVDVVKKTFTATYEQAQGDSINSVRWQIALIQNGSRRIMDDTGEVNTSVLSYTYNGFLTGNTYSVKCIVETENGVTVDSGWVTFDVLYEEADTTGELTASCAEGGEYVTLEWGKGTSVPGVASPESGISFDSDGLDIAEGASVKWETADSEPMNYQAPYTVAGRWDVRSVSSIVRELSVQGEVYTISTNPTGNLMFVGGSFPGYARLYVVNGAEAVFWKTLKTQGGAELNGTVYGSDFSPNGSDLLICGAFAGRANLYGVSGTEASYRFSLTELVGIMRCCAFNPSGNYFAVAGEGGIEGSAFIYTNNSSQARRKIPMSNTSETFDGDVRAVAWHGENHLFLAGTFTGGVNRYSVNGDIATSSGSLKAGDRNLYFGSSLAVNGNYLVAVASVGSGAGTVYDYTGIVYSIMGNTPVFIGFAKGADEQPVENALTAGFLPSGDALLLDDGIYTFNGETFAYSARLVGVGSSLGIPYNSIYAMAFFTGTNDLVIGGSSSIGVVFYNIQFTERTLLQLNSTDATISETGGAVVLTAGEETLASITVAHGSVSAVLTASPTDFSATFLNRYGQTISSEHRAVQWAQDALHNISLFGKQRNYWLYVASGDTTVPIANGKPFWNAETLLFTDYSGETLQAGTQNSTSSHNALYRLDIGNNQLDFIGDFGVDIGAIRDYGIKSGRAYQYELFYVNNGAYSQPISSKKVCKLSPYYVLIEAKESETDANTFYAVNAWKFGSNIEAGTVTNSNAPSFLQNFTPYPLRQPSCVNARQGLLSALISNFKDYEYKDTTEEMNALYALSNSRNTLFLKDMKGNLYMVHTSGAITQTINTRTAVMEVTVSIPWQEVGSAEGVSVLEIAESGKFVLFPNEKPAVEKPTEPSYTAPSLTELSVSENGIYLPQNGYAGFSKVDVDVPQEGGDSDIIDVEGVAF